MALEDDDWLNSASTPVSVLQDEPAPAPQPQPAPPPVQDTSWLDQASSPVQQQPAPQPVQQQPVNPEPYNDVVRQAQIHALEGVEEGDIEQPPAPGEIDDRKWQRESAARDRQGLLNEQKAKAFAEVQKKHPNWKPDEIAQRAYDSVFKEVRPLRKEYKKQRRIDAEKADYNQMMDNRLHSLGNVASLGIGGKLQAYDEDLIAHFASSGGKLDALLKRVFGKEGEADNVNRSRQELAARGTEIANKAGVSRWFSKPGEIIAGIAPDLAANMAVPGSLPIIMAADGWNNGLTEARDAGLSEAKAHTYAGVQGVIGYVSGKFTSDIIKPGAVIPKQTLVQALKDGAKKISYEYGNMAATNFASEATANVMGVREEELTFDKVKDILGETAIQVGTLSAYGKAHEGLNRFRASETVKTLQQKYNLTPAKAGEMVERAANWVESKTSGQINELASKLQPTRGDFEKAKVPGKYDAGDRAAFTEAVRKQEEANQYFDEQFGPEAQAKAKAEYQASKKPLAQQIFEDIGHDPAAIKAKAKETGVKLPPLVSHKEAAELIAKKVESTPKDAKAEGIKGFFGGEGKYSDGLKDTFKDAWAKGKDLPDMERNSMVGKVVQQALKRGYPKDAATLDKAFEVIQATGNGRDAGHTLKEFDKAFPKKEAAKPTDRRQAERPKEFSDKVPQTLEDLKGMLPAEIVAKIPASSVSVADMTEVQRVAELYRSPIKGMPLGNKRAYLEDLALRPNATHFNLDGDGLKSVNDIVGHEFGDVLLQKIGQALQDEGVAGYHLSGDEFKVLSDHPDIDRIKIQKAIDRLAKTKITYKLPDDRVFEHSGAGFSFGEGKNDFTAEEGLKRHKAEREAAGLRSSERKWRPPGLVEVTATGRDIHSGDAAKEPTGTEQVAPSPLITEEHIPETLERRVPQGSFKQHMEMDELPGYGDTIGSPEIIKSFSKLFDVTIRTGHFNGKAAGIYKALSQVVRLGKDFASNLAVASHEVAHKVDLADTGLTKNLPAHLKAELKPLDYEPQKGRTTEGFAEFIRMWLTNPTELRGRAPQFKAWWEGTYLPANPELQTKFTRIKELVDQYQGQGAKKRVAAMVSETGKPLPAAGQTRSERMAGFLKTQWSEFYKNWVNDANIIEQFQGKATEKGSDQKFYATFTALKGSAPAFAEAALNDAVRYVSKDRFRQVAGKSLKQHLAEIRPDELGDFTLFTYARHALESWQKGKNPGISKEDAQYVYDQFKDNQRYVKAADGLTEFNNVLLDVLVDAGQITQKTADVLKTAYQTYIPLRRVVEDKVYKEGSKSGKYLDASPGLHRRFGSDLPIINPITATMQRAAEFYGIALKQQVMQEMVTSALKTKGLGAWIEEVPKGKKKIDLMVGDISRQLKEHFDAIGLDATVLDQLDPLETLSMYQTNLKFPGEPIAHVTINGEIKLFEFDKDLYQLLGGINEVQLPGFLRSLQAASKIIKLGATGVSPNFALTNMVRDYAAYLVQRKSGGVVDPFQMATIYAYSEIQRAAGGPESGWVKLWREMGGELGQQFGGDVDTTGRAIRHALNDSKGQRALDAAKHPLDSLRHVIGVSEVGPRLAEFKGYIEKAGYSEADLKSDKVPREVLIGAINAAHDVTVDFRRGGRYGKAVNAVVPFFNAFAQGLDKSARTWVENPKKVLLYAAAYSSAALVYWLFARDEDWYDEAPAWQKYGYYTFNDSNGKPTVRIPRAREWSIIPGGVEALADSIYRHNPTALKEWSVETLKQNLPPIMPAGAGTVSEVYYNYDNFRDQPIVNEHLQKLKPEDQYNSYTSELMKAIGKEMEVSPAKLEHLASGLTGGAYNQYEKTGEKILFGKHFETADIPGAGGVLLRKDYSKSMDEFYRKASETSQEYESANAHAKVEKRKGLKGEIPDEIEAEYRRLEFYKGIMSKLKTLNTDIEGRDARFDVEKFEIGLARRVIGSDNKERYPNPFTAKDVPSSVREVIDEALVKLGDALSSRRPFMLTPAQKAKGKTFTDVVNEWKSEKDQALRIFNDLGGDRDALVDAYWTALKKKVKSIDVQQEHLARMSATLNNTRKEIVAQVQGKTMDDHLAVLASRRPTYITPEDRVKSITIQQKQAEFDKELQESVDWIKARGVDPVALRKAFAKHAFGKYQEDKTRQQHFEIFNARLQRFKLAG